MRSSLNFLKVVLFSVILFSACSDKIVVNDNLPLTEGSEDSVIPNLEELDQTILDDEIDQTELSVQNEISLPALMVKEFDGSDLVVGEVLLENSEYTRYYITYKSGDLTISGIMNVPNGEGPFPVLILNHGYIDPVIYTNGRGLKREQDYFAREGFIVIHPDYRNHAFSSKTENDHLNLHLGYTEDVINAVYAVKESDLEYFDKDNVGMLGHSMGGGITQNIIVSKPNLIKAAVLYAPVSSDYRDNFNKWGRNNTERGPDVLEKFGDFEENPRFWDELSPINYIDRIEIPVMIQHGTADDSTPIEWSDKLNDKLESQGIDVTYHVYEGAPHEFVGNWNTFMERNTEFFSTHLK